MPSPTAAPIVLSTGLTLAAAGLATNLSLSVVGLVVAAIGIAMWMGQLLPGRGQVPMPAVEPAWQPTPIVARPGTVETLVAGRAGYRMRMPEQVHPLSAGIKGGIVGGIVMPLPALTYGLLSGHGLWYPVNLLAGMVLPGVGTMSVAELQEFQMPLFLIAGVIHVAMSLMLGLIYGVLLPTLPDVPKPLAWGGLLMPLVWTAASYKLMGWSIRCYVAESIGSGSSFRNSFSASCWPLFIMRARRLPLPLAGLMGGLVGGALMAVPAVAWSVANGHGIWYPVNLLAAMAVESVRERTPEELTQFHAEWFAWAVAVHAVMSATFGLAYGILLPWLPRMPGPLAWGGLVMPLLWTGMSFGLMGVVNPVLQERVDWPWFIVSQFIFGLVAAVVVVRSEMVHIPPAGAGPDNLSTFVEGGP